MSTLTLTQVRAGLADLVAGLRHGGDPVVLTRHGAPVAALVLVRDLEELHELRAAAGRVAPGAERRPWCSGTG